MAESVFRSTAVAEATPRFAILGATSFTDVEVGVSTMISGPAADKYASVIARWVDASNYLQAELHLNSADTLTLRQVVAGTPTVLATTTHPSIQQSQWYKIRLIAYVSGRAVAQVLDSTGTAVLAGVEASSTAIATAGAIASGKPGFADQSTGTTAATRYYDDSYAGVPPAEPIVVYSGRAGEIRHDSAIRQDSTGTYYGDMPSYRGGRFLIPPAGSVGRTSRIFVKARRNDVDTAADDQITDSTTVAVHYTPRYLVIPR